MRKKIIPHIRIKVLVTLLVIVAIISIEGCARAVRCSGTPQAVADCICNDLNNRYKDDRAAFDSAVQTHPNQLVRDQCQWKWD